MKKHYHKLENWVKHRSIRERVLLLLMSMSVVYMLANITVFIPIEKKQNIVELKQIGQRETIKLLTTQANNILADVHHKTGASLHSHHTKLSKQAALLDKKLREFSTELISPEKMAEVLKDLIKGNHHLHLVRLMGIPSEEIQKAKTKKEQRLYEHRLLIELEGNFFDIKRYLTKVEKLKWHIFWDEIEYHVIKYPKARVSIKLHTMSTKEAWISA